MSMKKKSVGSDELNQDSWFIGLLLDKGDLERFSNKSPRCQNLNSGFRELV